MKEAYPAIFIKTGDSKDTYLVEIPDWNLITEGYGIADAVSMAQDVICQNSIEYKKAGKPFPKPTDINQKLTPCDDFKDSGEFFVSLVIVDFSDYMRKHERKSVRRNVTLPSWLNAEAEEAGLNISRVLQEALKEKLKIA